MITSPTREEQLYYDALDKNGKAIHKAANQGRFASTKFGNLVNNQKVIGQLAKELEAFITDYIIPLEGNAKTAYGVSFEYLTTRDFSHTDKHGEQEFFTLNQKCEKFIVIGLSACMNGYYSSKLKDSMSTPIAVSIGRQIEQESIFNSFKLQNEYLFDAVWAHNMKDPIFGTEYAFSSMTKFLESKDLVKGKTWVVPNNVIYTKVGQVILSIITGTIDPLFKEGKVMHNGNNTSQIQATPRLEGEVDGMVTMMRTSAFAKKPMLVTPNPWSEDVLGGYQSNGLAINLPLVRQKPGFEVGTAGPIAINMINNLQEVALKVNPKIQDIATQCANKGISLDSFVVPHTKDAAYAKRIKTRKNVPTQASLAEATSLLNEEQFFLPWSFDSRGRVYPQASTLNTQSTDFGKSLVMFAEPGPFNKTAEKWLAIHIANCWGNGVDKRSLTERIDWVKSAGTVLIKKIVTSPLAVIKSWNKEGNSSPSEPWQLIAAAYEWYACVISKVQTTTSIMCATDATCSGLQILTGLMLDEQASTFVNVQNRPDGTIGDAYTACANLAVKKFVAPSAKELKDTSCVREIKELLSGKNGRKFSKKVVMTTPYNSNEHRQGGEILELFKEFNIKLPKPSLQARIMARSLRSALKELMPNVINGMEAISKSVFDHVKADQLTTISWTSPSGFKVVQSKYQVELQRIKMLGSNQTIAINSILWDQVNPRKHKTSTAPNLVHSIDGACLHIAFEKVQFPFSLIHDSVLTRACDMEDAVQLLKQTYVDVFTKDVLGDFCKEVGMEVPISKGNLDVNCVLDSQFYFS